MKTLRKLFSLGVLLVSADALQLQPTNNEQASQQANEQPAEVSRLSKVKGALSRCDSRCGNEFQNGKRIHDFGKRIPDLGFWDTILGFRV